MLIHLTSKIRGTGGVRKMPLAVLAGSIALVLPATAAQADSNISYTGTLATSEPTFEATLTLAFAEKVALPTYGFGGGVNGSGHTIAPGGTDPFQAIFEGTGSAATILTDGGGMSTVPSAGSSRSVANDPVNCPDCPAGHRTWSHVPQISFPLHGYRKIAK
jgi:hypothetical protein